MACEVQSALCSPVLEEHCAPGRPGGPPRPGLQSRDCCALAASSRVGRRPWGGAAGGPWWGAGMDCCATGLVLSRPLGAPRLGRGVVSKAPHCARGPTRPREPLAGLAALGCFRAVGRSISFVWSVSAHELTNPGWLNRLSWLGRGGLGRLSAPGPPLSPGADVAMTGFSQAESCRAGWHQRLGFGLGTCIPGADMSTGRLRHRCVREVL